MLRLKISKKGLDTAYLWIAEVWLTGHDQPLTHTRHISRKNAQRAGDEALHRLEKQTRRGAFDWRFCAGDNFPRAWGWLEYSASATHPAAEYLHMLHTVISSTGELPVHISWTNATHTFDDGTLTVRAPFKTAWGSAFTEKRLRESNPNIRIDWEERDWIATLEQTFKETA